MVQNYCKLTETPNLFEHFRGVTLFIQHHKKNDAIACRECQLFFVILQKCVDTMQERTEQIGWYDRLWAALIFFTRLPLWRLHQPPRESFRSVVEFWPLAGWVTGGIMGGTLYLCSLFMPIAVAVIVAIAVRLLVTGALHEDGLADFIDGMGGGVDRERILAIMKDSHIGTYGVLGLVVYVLLLAATLFSLPPAVAALGIVAADPYAKMLSSQLVSMLPYARTEETAKNHTVYRRPSIAAGVGQSVQGLLPMVAFLWLTGIGQWYYIIFVPGVVMYFLYMLIWRKLQGYTGDCCGAVCLLVELATLLTIVFTCK